MGIKWVTEIQEAWLKDRLHVFRETQAAKTTVTKFFPEIHCEWRRLWPIEAPTPDEITKAEGNVEKATIDKRKTLEGVSVKHILDMKFTYAITSVFKRGSIITAAAI